ncbi:hypothetical protein ACFQFQ_14490 [Sulfitobacter porphyrae]|uniref:Uncharacterized protein n=1 Tax=Sulfitobacter porphyrae TaxID=1246864 RepID=A0ABW2B5H6_9RHOB|nr:hypothetical protein GCM10007928_02000 [Sulfitobacter porphyrae]
MTDEKLTWKTIDTGMGWNRHEGVSENFGPYIVEKEDTRSFSIWWGGVGIGEADSYAAARHVAQDHCNGLSRVATKEQPNDPHR